MAYGYGGYPTVGGYYSPPMPDQLAQLRQGQYQAPMMGQAPQAMTQPVQAPAAVANAPTQPASNGILWVQGEEGAKAWFVAPGSTVMLMDSDGSSFYLKSADASGMPQPLRIFDYTERQTAPKIAQEPAQIPTVEYVTRQEFEALEAKIDALNAKKAPVAKKTVKEDEDNG